MNTQAQLQQKERQLALTQQSAALGQFGQVAALRRRQQLRKAHVPSVQNKRGMSLVDPRERAQKRPKGAVFADDDSSESESEADG